MSLRRETARHHVITHTLIKKPGFSDRRAYVLYVFDDITSVPQAMLPLVDYVLEHGRTRSSAWQREVASATGLFVDFIKANTEHFQSSEDRPQVLSAFAEALTKGTIDADGTDTSGLYWQPKTVNRASAILNSLTIFSDWLVNRYNTTAINPWREASMPEQIAYWRRFDKRRSNALLMHTYDRDDAVDASKRARTARVLRKSTTGDQAPVKYFPNDRIWDLLEKGFAVHGKQKSLYIHERLNIRDILITILLHGGGLRESEPFHLYVGDVSIAPNNPKSALVRLYHPEQGMAPEDFIDPITKKRIDADREEYLRIKWGLEPRSLSIGRFHAGWKDLHLTDQRQKYALVHWFPSFWGEVFLELFKIYITKIRSRHSKHPYLFVSQKDNVAGEPYTVASYRQSHAKAVKRIGLDVGKDFGTTPHGHRHAYGQLLTDAKLDAQSIQHCLHHRSQESQQVYTEPGAEAISMSLDAASKKMEFENDWVNLLFRKKSL